MDYPKTALQQFGQPANVPAEISPYDAHQRAVSEWFEACKAFTEISARRSAAEKQLQQACQILNQYIEQTFHDPTCPPPAPPPQPTNGLVGNYNLGQR